MYPKRRQAVKFDMIRFSFDSIGERKYEKTWGVDMSPKKKEYIRIMRLRPFAWVIIAVNAYFFVSFFMDYDPNGDSTANGIGIMVLFLWLAILNVVLYVIYRITAGRKNVVNVTLESQLKEIERLKASGLITDEEYSTRRKILIEGK